MGITGLIPFLRKASRPSNIKDFGGCTVAIDTYCWLHKGAFSCADKLGTGQETTQYVYYCMKYVNFLLSCGIKPIMVFDGCRLPSKQGVEKARQERREVNRKKAKQLLREGRNAEAKEYLQRSIDITPRMALELMKTCRDKGVDCIVAPYEADAQLAYLNKAGIADVIITEDSDLVLFGCDRIMFKMDFLGNGLLVESTKLPTAMDLRPDIYSFDKFRYMCILAGCDYLPNLPGIGLGKACKLFKITRQTDIKMILRKLPTSLKMSNLTVSDDYIEGFLKANNTFLYQLVYDPLQRKLKPLHPYTPEVVPEEMTYAGKPFPAEKAYHIALGNIDIYTGEKIADFDPDTQKTNSWDPKKPHQLSIWDKKYQPLKSSGVTPKSTQPKDLPTTRGKEVKVKLPLNVKQKPVPVIEDAVSDHDLLDMYELENVEPAAKRLKIEHNKSPGKKSPGKRSPNKQSPKKAGTSKLSFNDLDTQSVEVTILDSIDRVSRSPVKPTKSPVKSTKSPVKCARSPLKSPNHENIASDNVASPASSEKKTPKNIFAKNSNRNRQKFQLNAGKVNVKESRFFKQAEPLRKTAFGEALGEELGDKLIKQEEEENGQRRKDEEMQEERQEEREEEEEGQMDEGETMQITRSLKNEAKSPLSSFESPQQQASRAPAKFSLQQAFGFKKLNPSPRILLNGSSPGTSNPFKPVISSRNSSQSSNLSLKSLSQKSPRSLKQSQLSLLTSSLSQKSLGESSQNFKDSDVSDFLNESSEGSALEDSFTSQTSHGSQSQNVSQISSNYLNANHSKLGPSSDFKLKSKGNLKRKCVDIASMFSRVPKKTFQYSAVDSANRTEEISTPDLPCLPDVM